MINKANVHDRAETRKFWANLANNTIAVDALAPCVSKSSVTMVLIAQYKQVLVFYGKDFSYLHYLSVQNWQKMQTNYVS